MFCMFFLWRGGRGAALFCNSVFGNFQKKIKINWVNVYYIYTNVLSLWYQTLGNQLKFIKMEYTAKQIENAKKAYASMLVLRTIESYEPQYIGYVAAEQRCDHHNRIVRGILAGDKALEREWKLFFLNEEVKKDRKENESKAKLVANKEASADLLAPIKSAKRIGEFGKWLNTSGNPFRKEHFSKKYTQESVNTFLAI